MKKISYFKQTFCSNSTQFNLKFNLFFLYECIWFFGYVLWTAQFHAHIWIHHCNHYLSQKYSYLSTTLFAKQKMFLLPLFYMAPRYHLTISTFILEHFMRFSADSLHKQRVCCKSTASRWDLKRLLTSWWLGNTEISLLIQLSAQQRHVWVAKCSGSWRIALQ